jgi:hypothetical protein
MYMWCTDCVHLASWLSQKPSNSLLIPLLLSGHLLILFYVFMLSFPYMRESMWSYLSESGLFFLTQCPLASSIFLQVAVFHSSLWLNYTPLYIYSTFSLCAHLLTGTYVMSYLSHCEKCCNKHVHSGVSFIWWLHFL